MKSLFTILFVISSYLGFAQNTSNKNSETREFIEEATFTQINRDWTLTAEFESGIGETITFFPVEVIDLKSNKSIKALEMDMNIEYEFMGKKRKYFKSSWIDLDEIDELIIFLESYVMPNLKNILEKKQSKVFVFNSRELKFEFGIEEKDDRKISVYLKDFGSIDDEHYFWTRTQVNKLPKLLEMLKQIK